MNKTADTFRSSSKTQSCITFVGTRSGVDTSFMCARKGGYEDFTKAILRHFEASGFLNPVILQCDKEMRIIDVCSKLARERKARRVLRFAPKQVIRATALPKQYKCTYRDSHDAIRHKSRRTLAYSFQQCHLPSHLLFVSLDLYCQHSQFDPTVDRHSSICSELHMFHFRACLVSRYSRGSPTMKCEQPS